MLKTKKVATASAVGAGMLKRKKLAPTSEGSEIPEGTGKTTEAILSEVSEILKLKEAFGATRLWRQMGVPGALECWVKAREEEAKAEEVRQPKKRKMVLKIEDMSDEELANQTESFRELYALVKFVDDKMNAYEQALLKQYDSKGYAKDETEVTDGRRRPGVTEI